MSNTLIKKLRADRAKVYDQAKAVTTSASDENRAFTDAEETRWRALSAELDAFDDRIRKLVDGDKRAQESEGAFARLGGGRGRLAGPPSLLPDESAFTELHRAATSGESLRVETRAVVLTSDTGADELATQLQLSRREPRRIAVAGAIPSQEVNGVEGVQFPVFGAGDADIVGEGVAKPEYDNVTPGSATPQVISIWLETTRQNLTTMTNFEAKLRNVLAAKVARREDLLIVATVTGTTGIQGLVGALSPDLVLEGAAMVAAGDVAAEPNLLLLNPADVPTVLGTEVGQGGQGSPSFSAFLPVVHGMGVYVTDHVIAGEAIVGAWSTASRFIIGIRPVVLVDSVSGIRTNVVTILEEEAVALAIDEPQGFVRITAT